MFFFSFCSSGDEASAIFGHIDDDDLRTLSLAEGIRRFENPNSHTRRQGPSHHVSSSCSLDGPLIQNLTLTLFSERQSKGKTPRKYFLGVSTILSNDKHSWRLICVLHSKSTVAAPSAEVRHWKESLNPVPEFSSSSSTSAPSPTSQTPCRAVTPTPRPSLDVTFPESQTAVSCTAGP